MPLIDYWDLLFAPRRFIDAARVRENWHSLALMVDGFCRARSRMSNGNCSLLGKAGDIVTRW